MSIFSKILDWFTKSAQHESQQEQRIQYLETELEQTKRDLQEVQSLLGSIYSEMETQGNQTRLNKNAVRNVQRRLRAMEDKRLKQRQAT